MKCRPILLLCLLSPMLLGAKTATPPPAQAEPAAATTEAPPVLKAPPIREETRRSKVLEEQLKRVDKETEILWLGEGDSQFLGLFLADHSGATFANALILHDNLQHPDWPGVVHELRTVLAAHGWNTLSIAMPDYRLLPQLPADTTSAAVDPAAASSPDKDGKAEQSAPAPQDAAPADPAASSVEEKSVEYLPEQVPDEVDRRARAGSELLRQKSTKPMVVIAIGLSAGFAAKKAQTMLIKDIAGLVIIDPVQPRDADFNTDLDAMDLRIPILDIAPEFFPRTDPVVRLHSAGRAHQNQFEQRIVRGARPDFSTQENAVIKAVRGWGERWLRKKKR